jgi:hypothetical protein
MSWVRSGWHEEEVNGSKAVVECLSLLWLHDQGDDHDHDGLLSDICSAILSLGFHCTNRHQMFTFNKMSLLWSCFSSATISFTHIMLLPFKMLLLLLLLSGVCSALDSYICFHVTFKVLLFWSFFLSATCVSSLCHLPSNGSFCNQRPPPLLVLA